NQPELNPDGSRGEITPHHLAYVIYTSGSTGLPKGAMNEQLAVVNRLVWMQYAYGLDQRDSVLQKTPFSFDVSVWEFFWPLIVGARLVMARPGGQKDPAYLIDIIQQENITTAHFVPSMLQAFLEGDEVMNCSTLARVICSGEALPAAFVRRFQKHLPDAQLHNLYGPTEAAVDVTAWACPSSLSETIIPIGRPISNARIYIIDAYGQPAPVGAAGEIYIGGAPVGRGYLNRPELTAERFVVDPFAGEAGARMYKTGDLGRWMPDGVIEFLGRNDFQIKIRGFRIELEEIEARLREHPGVQEAVVMAREDGPGDKRLVAYYTRAKIGEQDEYPISVEALRAHLSASLPEYMAPAAYVPLEAMPLTPNGKLDRRALPKPELNGAGRVYVAPRTAMEEIVSGIWAEVLRIEKVGLTDNFFDMGGHSL